jgi:hypothetical protein
VVYYHSLFVAYYLLFAVIIYHLFFITCHYLSFCYFTVIILKYIFTVSTVMIYYSLFMTYNHLLFIVQGWGSRSESLSAWSVEGCGLGFEGAESEQLSRV